MTIKTNNSRIKPSRIKLLDEVKLYETGHRGIIIAVLGDEQYLISGIGHRVSSNDFELISKHI